MQLRIEKIILLSVYSDRLTNLTFAKVLTESRVETVKLPTVVENYRLGHLLQPNYVLEVELLKTRKNWILKHILSHQNFCQLTKYTDHLKFAQLMALLNQYTRDGQDVDLLSYLVGYFEHSAIANLDLVEFESKLLERLGFAPKLPRANRVWHLQGVKTDNGLI